MRLTQRDNRPRSNVRTARKPSVSAMRCRRKFLGIFPEGFRDSTYLKWEREYKWETHQRWDQALGRKEFRRLLREGKFAEVAARAIWVEQRSRHSMIFSFEKMALRDAVKTEGGAREFAEGLYVFLYGPSSIKSRFNRWVEHVAALPRKQTRVLTWPIVTVFSFIAQPDQHLFLKPNVTQAAAREYGFDLSYQSRPSWETYASLLKFAELIRHDLRDLRPRDMIDIQSFMWVQGSDEYDE